MADGKAQVAAEVFQKAYRLYAKYAGGNMDLETYWYNVSADADKAVKEYPCGLMQDLVQAVLSELNRERKINEQ